MKDLAWGSARVRAQERAMGIFVVYKSFFDFFSFSFWCGQGVLVRARERLCGQGAGAAGWANAAGWAVAGRGCWRGRLGRCGLLGAMRAGRDYAGKWRRQRLLARGAGACGCG